MKAAGTAGAAAGGNVAEYHFVSSWQIQAPIERVWAEISRAEDWPSWWKYVAAVQEMEPGDADGTGKRLRLTFRTRLPYTLSFDTRVVSVRPPSDLTAEASGELAGTGRWELTPAGGGTLVRYYWDIRTTRAWMNLAAPLARPVFSWNHHELMREGGLSLGRRLGAEVTFPDESSGRDRTAGRTAAVAAVAALGLAGVLGVLRRRRRTASH
jgi:uncharacterized protein YndB with AHSA1/START domain